MNGKSLNGEVEEGSTQVWGPAGGSLQLLVPTNSNWAPPPTQLHKYQLKLKQVHKHQLKLGPSSYTSTSSVNLNFAAQRKLDINFNQTFDIILQIWKWKICANQRTGILNHFFWVFQFSASKDGYGEGEVRIPKRGVLVSGWQYLVSGQGLAMFDIENGNVWSWLAMFSLGDGNEWRLLSPCLCHCHCLASLLLAVINSEKLHKFTAVQRFWWW